VSVLNLLQRFKPTAQAAALFITTEDIDGPIHCNHFVHNRRDIDRTAGMFLI